MSHSDILGGAAIVTYRLMNAIREEGIDARMIVYTKSSDDPNVSTISNRWLRGMRFMEERALIAICNGFSRDDLFKVSVANVGFNLHHHPWIKDADAIVLGWVNQGMISLKGIKNLCSLGKPVIWTMHDMWCMTGVCHHAYECSFYEKSCGNCRFLGVGSKNDLSNHVWKRKMRLYDNTDIKFVAVSNWLAECSGKSSLLKNRGVVTIPNAFPIESFSTTPQHDVHTLLNLPDKRKIILMGAARLDDPIKGLTFAIDALNYLFDNRPDVAREAIAVFFGEIRNPAILDRLRFANIAVGRINDTRLLHDLYATADVVLSTSLYETLPGTLIEGQASGCLPVTFGKGGQRDIVTHKVDGYIAKYKDITDVAQGIIWAFSQNVDREKLHNSVKERFSAKSIALRYIDLVNAMCENHDADTNALK